MTKRFLAFALAIILCLSLTVPAFAAESERKETWETMEEWEAMFADFPYTGEWPTDLLGVAKTQVGYMESMEDRRIGWDKNQHGYTRYSHWFNWQFYGEERPLGPYEWWCADFVSFCLHYAGVPAEYMPADYNCQRMANALDASGYYRPYYGTSDGFSYTPKAGDIIFFDYENDGYIDHVGIVSEYEEAKEVNGKLQPALIHTIEGNVNFQVMEREYTYWHDIIVGFGDTQAAYDDYINDIYTSVQNMIQEANVEQTDSTAIFTEGAN